jgi:hypothetical protein
VAAGTYEGVQASRVVALAPAYLLALRVRGLNALLMALALRDFAAS